MSRAYLATVSSMQAGLTRMHKVMSRTEGGMDARELDRLLDAVEDYNALSAALARQLTDELLERCDATLLAENDERITSAFYWED